VNTFLLVASAFVLGTTALGLIRVLRGPTEADRMMAAQLLGTGGIAIMLMVGDATGSDGVGNVALTLALVAAFASIAFTKNAAPAVAEEPAEPGRE
jgi:multicomponent Na+:H+ antiporter subunit F